MENRFFKWTIAFVIFFSASIALAQNKYQVYSVEGNVYMKTTTMTPLKKRVELNLADQVVIQQSSVLRIVVYPSGVIYSVNVPGTYRVKEIIDSHKKRSESYISSVNKQMAAEKKSSGDYAARVIGASSRGSEASSNLNNLAKGILSDIESGRGPKLERIEGDGYFHLRIFIPHSGIVPVALFCCSENNIEALYKESIWVSSGFIELPDTVFSSDTECSFFAAEVDDSVYLPDLARILKNLLFPGR